MSRLGETIMLAAIPCAILVLLSHVAHYWSYALQGAGFAPDVIRRAMQVRPKDFFWEAAWTPLPIAGIVCVASLWSEKSAAFRWRALSALTVGCCVAVAWLFAQTWLTYR